MITLNFEQCIEQHSTCSFNSHGRASVHLRSAGAPTLWCTQQTWPVGTFRKHTQGGHNSFQHIDHNSHTNMNLSTKKAHCQTIRAPIISKASVEPCTSNMLSSAKDTLSRRASCVSRMSLSCTAFSCNQNTEKQQTFSAPGQGCSKKQDPAGKINVHQQSFEATPVFSKDTLIAMHSNKDGDNW